MQNLGNLTISDVDLMLNGLDAFETKSDIDGAMSAMLGVMLSNSKEEASSYLEKEKKRDQERQPEIAALKERIALVRAKLILIRREMEMTEVQDIVSNLQS